MIHRRPRLAGVLVAAVTVALVASGCGGDGPEASTQEPSSSASASATASASAPAPTPTPAPASASASAAPLPPPPQPRAGMPKVGQCFQMSARQTRAAVSTARRVRCRSPHTAVVAYARVVRPRITAQTPIRRRRAIARRVCTPAFARAAGGSPADRATSLLTWVFFTPSAADVERGARWVRCDLVARSGDVLVPLVTSPPLLSGGVPENLRICQDAAGTDVSCTRKHTFRVDAVYREDDPTYPDPDTYTAIARDRCRQLMQGYGGYWQPPGRAGWAAGDRFVRCLRQDPAPTPPG